MRRYLALVMALWLGSLAGAWAGGADDQYFEIYKLIRQGDSLSQAGQTNQALAKYTEALTALRKFQQTYPEWNTAAVNFRLVYLADKINELSPRPAPAAGAPAAPPPARPGPAQPTPAQPTPAQPAPAPADWEDQLNALKEQARQLQADKVLLEAKLKEALAFQPAAADAGGLAKAAERITALQKENDLLKASLEQAKAQAKAAGAPATPAAAAPAPAPAVSLEAVRALETQRDELARKLEAANQGLAAAKVKPSARVAKLQTEIEGLRAKLDALEAQKVPYTREELAVLQPGEAKLAGTNTVRRSVRDLPAGLAALVTEAQRRFNAKDFEKAEELYLQVLREDEKNVGALANLAMIQLRLRHYEAAGKHIKQALELAPDDPYCLEVLGRLRWLEQKPDEAFDALSRAAQFDPQNADVQDLLGIVLSEKGQRAAAETAFRRALMLAPNFADAHQNLAYHYLVQQPPLTELGRWHYEKALAAGLPRNPEIERLLGQK